MKLERYTAIDVETPNGYGRSICSIGIVHVGPGRVPLYAHYLVNPDDEFDLRNILVHGIRPEDVENAPMLPLLWGKIAPYFTGGVLLAHNARFDLGVIGRALERCNLPVPDMRYVCTLAKSRRHIERAVFGSHRLATLCGALDIPLVNHHNALDDAKACALLFEYLQDKYGFDDADIRTFAFDDMPVARRR